LHTEELRNTFLSLNVRVIRSRRMRWTGRVARTGDKEHFGKRKGKRLLRDLRLYGRIILKCAMKRL
jgi:hypothetical protein